MSYLEKYKKYKSKYLDFKKQQGGFLYQRPNNNPAMIEVFERQHKECHNNPAVFPQQDRIIAIGDLHGDFNAMIKALTLSKVIDNNGNWIGDNTFVVQVGDILDCDRGGEKKCGTGAEELEILDFLFKLNKKAKKKGGRVITILGNHELMNVVGDFRYASSQHTEALGGEQARRDLFKPGGKIAKKMACNMQPIVKIGKYIFVHGAILPNHLDSIKLDISNQDKLQHLNMLVKKLLLGELTCQDFQDKYPNEYKIVGPRGELFWDRSLSKPRGEFAELEACNKSKQLLKKLNCDGGAIIMGHTPQDNITSTCNGSIWKIDVAMSEGFTNQETIQTLEIIENGKKINILSH